MGEKRNTKDVNGRGIGEVSIEVTKIWKGHELGGANKAGGMEPALQTIPSNTFPHKS